MSEPRRVIEFIGEGKTDIGEIKPGKIHPEPPISGVLPVLVHKLCGNPSFLQVIRRPVASLQRGGLQRKVRFAKEQAYYNRSDGVVFVVDTEGDHPDKKRAELTSGRDERLPDFPMAVGVAHPCIETWLLVDAHAISRGI